MFSNPLDPELGLEEEEELEQPPGMLETFQSGDIAGGLGQMAGMFMPQSLYGRHAPQQGLSGLFNDFVEFSPGYGDAKDLVTGIRGEEGGYQLDPLERGLAVFAGLGVLGSVGAVGAAGIKSYHAQRAKAAGEEMRAKIAAATAGRSVNLGNQAEAALSSMPAPGTPLTTDLQPPAAELPATPEERRNMAAQAVTAEAYGKHPYRYEIYSAPDWGTTAQLVLYRLGEDAAAANGRTVLRTSATLNVLGKEIVERSAERGITYGPADTEGIGPDVDAQRLTAAQRAMVKFLNAKSDGLVTNWRTEEGQLGIDEDTFEGSLNVAHALTGATDPGRTGEVLNFIADFEVLTNELGIGPDLAPTPQTKLANVYRAKDGSTRVVVGFHTELLPTRDARTVGHDNMPINKAELEARNRRLDYRTLSGYFTTNLVMAAIKEAKADPQRFKRSSRWYQNYNASAHVLARHSGESVQTVAAVLSALSPQTKWLPDNLIMGTHMILSHAGLEAGTAEFQAAFREVIEAGGWTNELYAGSGKKVRKQFKKNKPGIVDYWADPANVKTSDGTNVRGAEQNVKRRNVAMLLQAGVPWHVVLRMSKTHEFAALGNDPNLAVLAVIDTHSNNATTGTVYGGEPLGSKGVRTASYEELENGVVTPSGNMLTKSDLEATAASLKAARDAGESFQVAGIKVSLEGMTDADIETFVDSARKVPSEKALERYEAQQYAHGLALDILKEIFPDVKYPNQIQSTTWVPTQKAKAKLRKRIYRAKRRGELALIRDEAVFDRATLIDNAEGNPQFMPGVAGMTANASDDLNLELEFSLAGPTVAKTKDTTGQAIVIEKLPDGKALVAADIEAPGVAEVLRHLYPVRVVPSNGTRFWRMAPRHARKVAKINAVDRQVAELPASVEVRQWIGDDTQYVGFKPGNHVVVEVNRGDLNEVLGIVGQQGRAYTTSHHNVRRYRTKYSTRRLTHDEVLGLSRAELLDPEGPLAMGQWATISATTGKMTPDQQMKAHVRLGHDLVKRGYSPITVQGMWEGTAEPSWLVFGMDNAEAVAVGRKYNQYAVATTSGVFDSKPDVDKRGGEWILGEPSFRTLVGEEAKAQPGHTVLNLPDGSEVAFSLDIQGYGAHEAHKSFDQFTRATPRASESVRVEIDLGGLETGLPWNLVDELWRDLELSGKAQSMAAYTAGGLWAPPNTTKAYEHVYTDGNGQVRTYRHGEDVSIENPNQVELYVPNAIAATLPTEGADWFGRTRTFKEARNAARTTQTEGGMVINVGGDVEIEFPGEYTPTDTGSLLSGTLNGHKVKHVTVDLTGPVPRIVAGDSAVTERQGLASATVSRGRIRRITAWDVNELETAIEALEATGQSVDESVGVSVGSDVNIAPEFQPSAEAYVGTPVVGVGPGRYDGVLRIDDKRHIPLQLGANITADQASAVMNVVGGFIGIEGVSVPAPVARIVNKLGHVHPRTAWNGMRDGVRVFKFIQRADVYGYTWSSTERHTGRSININETMLVADQRSNGRYSQYLSKAAPGWFAGEGKTNLAEETAIHEFAHQVQRMASHNMGLDSIVFRRIAGTWGRLGPMGRARKISGYAQDSTAEMFAEAFVRYAYDPNVDPEVAALVEDVYHAATVDPHDFAAVQEAERRLLESIGAQ